MTRSSCALALVLVGALACAPSPSSPGACLTSSDCDPGQTCTFGRCGGGSDGGAVDGGSVDAGPGDAGADVGHYDGGPPLSCSADVECGAGLCCGSRCVDPTSDPEHCGACATSCVDEHVASGRCETGHCVVDACEPLYGDCNDMAGDGCELPINDVAHCGACLTSCTALNTTPTCAVMNDIATCDHGPCAPGFEDCDAIRANGCETDLTHPATCGSCGTDCTSRVLHATGVLCTPTGCDYTACAAGASDCDGNRGNGCEVWSATRCGASCTDCTMAETGYSGTPICSSAGTCDYSSCAPQRSDCDSQRANGCETAWSGASCGASCTNCAMTEQHASGPLCTSGGACNFASCTAGYSSCDSDRTNGCETAWSATACGASCTSCTTTVQHASALCTAGGACDYTMCASAFSDCDGNRANGCEAPWTSTSCGASCVSCFTMAAHALGQTCSPSGTCDYSSCQLGFSECDTVRSNGCETASNATHCSAACINCTTLPHVGSASCSAGACVLTCLAGYSNCDGDWTNGCELTSTC